MAPKSFVSGVKLARPDQPKMSVRLTSPRCTQAQKQETNSVTAKPKVCHREAHDFVTTSADGDRFGDQTTGLLREELISTSSRRIECREKQGAGNRKSPCSTIFFTILQEVQTKLPALEHLHHLRKLSER